MSRYSSRSFRQCREWVEAMLRAKLARRREDPAWREGCYSGRARIRSYHLSPRVGMLQHVRDCRSGRTIPIVAEDLFGNGGWDWFCSARMTGRILDRIMLDSRRP